MSQTFIHQPARYAEEPHDRRWLASRTFDDYSIRYTTDGSAFSRREQHRFVAQIASGLPDFNIFQYFATQPTIFEDFDHLAIAFESEHDEAIGILGSRWLEAGGLRFLYMWTGIIAGEYHGSPLFRRLSQFFFEELVARGGERPSILAAKSYNPQIYALFQSLCGRVPGVDLYPRVGTSAQDTQMSRLAVHVMRAVNPKLSLRPESGTVVGGQTSVAPDFFPNMSASRDPVVHEHFAANLTRDDQILCVLRIDESAAPALVRRVFRR